MPQASDVHIDRALTNLSVAYIQDESKFVAADVFPVVQVQKQSDRYFVYKREDWFRDEAEERAPATESAGGDYDIDNTPTYYARKYAFHKDVTEDDRVNSDSPLKPDEDAQQFATQKTLIKREVVWAANYFTTGKWTHELAGVASGTPSASQFLRFDNPDSDPLLIVSNAQATVAESTGFIPNILTIGFRVFTSLKNHPKILDRIKYTQRGVITEDMLAALFGVEKLKVAAAVINTAPKKKAGDYSFILGKNALLSYAPKSPGIKIPSAGYIFAWTGMLGAGAYGNRMVRLPMDHLGIGTERIECEMAFDAKLIAADLGFFFKDAVS